jgi:hypothetical protein
LKDCGHDLSRLVSKATEIAERHEFPSCARVFGSDPIYQTIIQNLTDFARPARYYNLDYLSGQRQSGLEPLKRWDSEVCNEIVRRHYRPRRDRIAEIEAMGAMLDRDATVWSMAEDGEAVDTVTDLLLRKDAARVKQKYSMYYLYVVVRELCDLCAELEWQGRFYPYLREFFVVFRNPDRSWILRKKSWNPHAPFHF